MTLYQTMYFFLVTQMYLYNPNSCTVSTSAFIIHDDSLEELKCDLTCVELIATAGPMADSAFGLAAHYLAITSRVLHPIYNNSDMLIW